MITEDYVSFETAKLLQEKGFKEPCNAYWFHMIGAEPMLSDNMPREVYNNKSDTIEIIGCPTQQIAMKWLREVHKLHIITIPYAPIDRPPYHPGEADIVYIAQLFKGIIPKDEVGRSIIKLTNEEACEAAIKFCLENL